MSNLENVCCPICKSKGTIKVEINSSIQDEPYFHMLPSKIYCEHCDTEFQHMKLEEDIVQDFSLVDYRQKYEQLQKRYKSLEKRFNIVYDDLMYIGVYQCPKCTHYTMNDFVCHECGYDKTEGDKHE